MDIANKMKRARIRNRNLVVFVFILPGLGNRLEYIQIYHHKPKSFRGNKELYWHFQATFVLEFHEKHSYFYRWHGVHTGGCIVYNRIFYIYAT
jgi:hypothetical protein